jgi:serine/threonine-protein kinase
MVGKTLTHYEILEKIGAGGMGEVYRARDSKLEREVAIKILPAEMVQDQERLARFRREARLLASLNNPGIATIHGLEQEGSTTFLVLELVKGEDLAERLHRRPLTLDESIAIALQIATALEFAHENGVVHRDLKPANIKIAVDGTVKLLDFGLAKSLEGQANDPAHSQSPTVTEGISQAGAILGTAAYMSPEQARGQSVDKRADVWGFGCVLYKMLAQTSPFAGKSVSDTLAAILTKEPDREAIPPETPEGVRFLIDRCLDKNAKTRLRDIGEARIILEGVQSGSPTRVIPGSKSRAPQKSRGDRVRTGSMVAVAVAAVLIAAWSFLRPSGRSTVEPVHLTMNLGANRSLRLTPNTADFAISPDGTRVVFMAMDENGARLYVREMESDSPEPLPGTEGAFGPFFSPDGRWVAFFAVDGTLKKISTGGGTPITICDASRYSLGGSWASDGGIVFASRDTTGLAIVSADGGSPKSISSPNRERGESSHGFPQFLPGEREILFTILRGGAIEDSDIAVLSLEEGTHQIVHSGGRHAKYASTGHLLYGAQNSLVAVPFDVARLEVTGAPFTTLENVYTAPWFGATHYDFSKDGTIIYTAGIPRQQERELVWVSREGVQTPVVVGPQPFRIPPRISPDSRSVVIGHEKADRTEVWIYDLKRGTGHPLDSHESHGALPFWTTDGRRIIFASNRTGPFNIFWRFSDGSGAAEVLQSSERDVIATSCSPDGNLLAYYEINPSTQRDLWILSLSEESPPRPFLVTPSDERAPMFSPDGRWIAYVSDESGRDEVYVRPYPGPGGKLKISAEGGVEPFWSENGLEIYYRHGRRLFEAAFRAGNSGAAGIPKILFEGDFLLSYNANPAYDIGTDGRFLMIRGGRQSRPSELQVVFGWFDQLRGRRSERSPRS